MAKGKKVSGCDYASDKEVYDRKKRKKDMEEMKTAGMARKLEKAEKDEGYSKKPRVKPAKKTAKIVSGKKKAY